MLDFSEIDINEYKYTYNTRELLEDKMLLRRKKKSMNEIGHKEYFELCLEEVKSVIIEGYRKYGEFENEWLSLRYEVGFIEKSIPFTETIFEDADYVLKLYILLDQAFLLLYEGLPLHSNPLIKTYS